MTLPATPLIADVIRYIKEDDTEEGGPLSQYNCVFVKIKMTTSEDRDTGRMSCDEEGEDWSFVGCKSWNERIASQQSAL